MGGGAQRPWSKSSPTLPSQRLEKMMYENIFTHDHEYNWNYYKRIKVKVNQNI